MQANILLLGSLWFLKSIYFTWLKMHQTFQIMHDTVVALITHYCVLFILSLQSKVDGFQHLKLEDNFISDWSIILGSLSSLSQ